MRLVLCTDQGNERWEKSRGESLEKQLIYVPYIEQTLLQEEKIGSHVQLSRRGNSGTLQEAQEDVYLGGSQVEDENLLSIWGSCVSLLYPSHLSPRKS